MNMECNEAEILLIDYLDEQLQNGNRKAVEKHIQTCAKCRLELDQYRELFQAIATHKLEKPGPLLRENFNTMLQSEINIVATTKIIELEKDKKPSPFINPSYLLKAAACLVLVASGIFIGTITKKNTAAVEPGTQMAELKNEVKEMKEALMYNLLNNESASERIRGVSYADKMNNPDQDVLHALINTLNRDENVNVRLAALNYVSKFTSSQMVRDSLITSLGKQKEPLIQIVLINILTDKKESRAIGTIREILLNKETLAPVKDVAEKGLKLL